jgi:hypothetical protein
MTSWWRYADGATTSCWPVQQYAWSYSDGATTSCWPVQQYAWSYWGPTTTLNPETTCSFWYQDRTPGNHVISGSHGSYRWAGNLTTKFITLLELFSFVSKFSRLQYEWSSDYWCIWKSFGVNACLQWRKYFHFIGYLLDTFVFFVNFPTLFLSAHTQYMSIIVSAQVIWVTQTHRNFNKPLWTNE